MYTPDDTDYKIMRTLQRNSSYTTKELAAIVELSPTPTYERVKRLEKEGYIKGYVAMLDAAKLEVGFSVYCNVKMKHNDRAVARQFKELIRELPEVTECYNVSGQFDYLLRVHAPDMAYYRRFILDTLGSLEYVASMESVFVMSEFKRTHELPLPQGKK